MHSHCVLVFVFLISFAVNGVSQITGFVYDENTKQPLSEVIIYYSNNKGRVSDEMGSFRIPFSNQSIRFYKFGYVEVVVDNFKAGDTVWMTLDTQFLRNVEIVSEPVSLHKLLKKWLKKSSNKYFVDSSVYRAYSHRDEYLLDDSIVSFIDFPKLYCNANSKGALGLNRPFSRPVFLPDDGLTGLFLEDNAFLRSSVGTIYEVKHHFPFLHINDFVARKTNISVHNSKDTDDFHIEGIINRHQAKEAYLSFGLNDSLLLESILWTVGSDNRVNSLMKMQASLFMKGYSFQPPYSEWVKVQFKVNKGVYLLDHMEIRSEMSLINRETDEIYLLKRKAVFKLINAKVFTLNELELKDAVEYGGFVDPIFHDKYKKYFK